jgi:hypothetical protein
LFISNIDLRDGLSTDSVRNFTFDTMRDIQ